MTISTYNTDYEPLYQQYDLKNNKETTNDPRVNKQYTLEISGNETNKQRSK